MAPDDIPRRTPAPRTSAPRASTPRTPPPLRIPRGMIAQSRESSPSSTDLRRCRRAVGLAPAKLSQHPIAGGSVSRFPGVDLLEVDALLGDEERLVRDTVRAFVDDKVKPIIEECHREGRTPLELVPEMGSLNLFGANLADYGLPGLGGVAYGLIMQELERGDSGLRSFASVQSSLVMYPIHAFGSQQQKDRWLPLLATGEAIGCFGLTEPDFGSNPGGMRTAARRVGDDWVLDGSKQWITNGTLADVAVVWARTDQGIRGFLVAK